MFGDREREEGERGYVTVFEMEERGIEGEERRRERKGVEESRGGERKGVEKGEGGWKRRRGGRVDYATVLVCLVSLQKMVWLDDKEERKRILMDLRVMTSHQSPYIVQYYGSVIWNVRAMCMC